MAWNPLSCAKSHQSCTIWLLSFLSYSIMTIDHLSVNSVFLPSLALIMLSKDSNVNYLISNFIPDPHQLIPPQRVPVIRLPIGLDQMWHQNADERRVLVQRQVATGQSLTGTMGHLLPGSAGLIMPSSHWIRCCSPPPITIVTSISI